MRERQGRSLRPGAVVAAVSLAWLLQPTTPAATYHVAAGECSHAPAPGSDSNAGDSREKAFLTVQRCLDRMKAGDTCFIHTGTYRGNFNCCGAGSASIRSTSATPQQPTRILGAPGDATTLAGLSNQTPPCHGPASCGSKNTQFATNLSTLTMKADRGRPSSFFEIGNLRILPGNAGALATPAAEDFYVHDISMDDLSTYVPFVRKNKKTTSPGETTGLFYAIGSRNHFFENIRVGNAIRGHAIVKANLFVLGSDGKVRMVEARDIEGALSPTHGRPNNVFEFVRLRNWRPWTGDDGALVDLYNSTYTVLRYLSVLEAPGGQNATYGWINARRSECAGAKVGGNRSGFYASNLSFEDAGGGSGYAAFHHEKTWIVERGGKPCTRSYVGIPDWRLYNSVAVRFPWGIWVRGDSHASKSMCAWHSDDYNAFVDVRKPIHATKLSAECDDAWRPGVRSLELTATGATDHVLSASSPLRDRGHDGAVGDTPLFPTPEGGGARIDIGAFEYGAGSWPYEFQSVKTIVRDPGRQSIRICWDPSAPSCDLLVPLWDPWARDPVTRVSTPDHVWLEIDPANSFRTGRKDVAPGFGAFYESGPVQTADRHLDVPAGTLAVDRSYYVQIRVGEQKNQSPEGEGPGPWSLGFYRFRVAAPAPPPP